MLLKEILELYNIDKKVYDFVNENENRIADIIDKHRSIRFYNQNKVNNAMQYHRLSYTDFAWSTGYGYGDMGREKTESIYATVFKAEDALVRPLIVSGTHAIYLCLSGLLRHGDELLYISGKPYDTLLKVIGETTDDANTLKDMGISFDYAPLDKNDKMQIDIIMEKIKHNTKLIAIQRSTGYGDRRAITIKEMEEVISAIKLKFDIPIFIDNCYGEFTEEREPLEIGADIIAGSLIKNPGAGIAASGGYIAGKKELVKSVTNRLTAPGLSKDCGLTFGMTRSMLQGLYFAPQIVHEAYKVGLLVGATFSSLGFAIKPSIDELRSDIVQAITFNNPELVKTFCKTVQKASVVDSHVIPEAWDMPGYTDKVIMATGGFIEGSSIELSADGPMRPPYQVFYQGGMNYDHGKVMVMQILQAMIKEHNIQI
ncbi:MAG: hypothetical protein GXZ11_00900 [Tissierellia bacterium]|nr:hypothetical protein [Tissierellia bacterium]